MAGRRLAFPGGEISVRLAHTRAGARLRQQPYSSPRSASFCRAFLFNRKHSFLLNKKGNVHKSYTLPVNVVNPSLLRHSLRGKRSPLAPLTGKAVISPEGFVFDSESI